MLWIIGDVHGEIDSYERICRRLHKRDPDAITLQVGDMGVGFRGVRAPACGPNDFWIAGNHDDALICEKCPGNLGDFGVRCFCGWSVFFLRGALSNDRHLRIDGETWWAYEELTDAELASAVQLYAETRPEVVATHDCPTQIGDRWFKRPSGRTVAALARMFELHRPRYWVFGHHHAQKQGNLDGTQFACVGELCEKKIAAKDAAR